MADYLVGVAYFVATVGAVAIAALTAVSKRYAGLNGTPLVLAIATLLTLGMVAAHVIPLAFGGLTRATVLATATALALAAWLLPASTPRARPGPGPPPSSGRAAVVLAAGGVAAIVVYELARVRFLATVPIADIDMLNFHLPGIARWIQSGSLWQIDQLFPYFVTGYYPNSGDAVTLAAVLPWREAAFARLVPVPFLVLTGLAVYALGCELRATRATAALFAAAAVSVPALSDYALEGLPDAIMVFGFVTGVLFLARHARSGRTAELTMAGLAFGLAFGTKWYGVTSVAAAIAVWAMVGLIARRGARVVIRQGAALTGLVVLTGGIWLLRNLIEAGNPLYPQPISIFGVTFFGGPEGLILDQVGFTIAGYLGDFSVMGDYILPGLGRELGLTGVLCAVGILAAAVLAVQALRRGAASLVDAVSIGTLLTVVAICALYAITPGSAFGEEGAPIQSFTTVRWLVPAPLLAAALTAAVATRLGPAKIGFEIAAAIAIVDGIRRGPDVPLSLVAQATAALTALALAGWFLYSRRARISELIATRRLAVAGTAAALLAVCAVAFATARAVEERVMDRGYGASEPAIAWIERHASAGERIALAGIWEPNGLSPAFPAFGPGLRNSVTYLGPWEEGLLREYTQREPFVAALREGGYELVLIGRGQPPDPPVEEEYWAHAAGYRPLAASPRLVLYGTLAAGRRAREERQ